MSTTPFRLNNVSYLAAIVALNWFNVAFTGWDLESGSQRVEFVSAFGLCALVSSMALYVEYRREQRSRYPSPVAIIFLVIPLLWLSFLLVGP